MRMARSRANLALLWDSTAVEPLVASRHWVLTAMQRHGPALITMLWRLLGNEQDVCDVYQETFLRLASRSDKTPPNRLKAFVFRSASNTAVSLLRRRTTHERACRRVAQHVESTDGRRPSVDLHVGELREALRNGIARLPERLQLVLVLKDIAEMSYPRVAKLLNLSVASVRVYRYRALRLLSRWMARQDES
ncbi:MAG: sigma-70 family RNA polymerase sigma factor [Phycisphaerae bacterium]|nr:sigma-70 family RNA polymerase sigma factor [Phycisphaerae bacterium]